MSTAYIVANVKVTNPTQYEEYRKFSSQAIQEHDAKILVRGGTTEHLEGQEPGRTVILGFKSMDAARAFYNSQTYKQGRQAREGAAEMTMYIVEGV